jgi:hypothetical protein
LQFEVKPGWLIQAIRCCGQKPFLVIIDEIDRADLSPCLQKRVIC